MGAVNVERGIESNSRIDPIHDDVTRKKVFQENRVAEGAFHGILNADYKGEIFVN